MVPKISDVIDARSMEEDYFSFLNKQLAIVLKEESRDTETDIAEKICRREILKSIINNGIARYDVVKSFVLRSNPKITDSIEEMFDICWSNIQRYQCLKCYQAEKWLSIIRHS